MALKSILGPLAGLLEAPPSTQGIAGGQPNHTTQQARNEFLWRSPAENELDFIPPFQFITQAMTILKKLRLFVLSKLLHTPMLANYIDSILFEAERNPDRVQDAIDRLKRDIPAFAQLEKLNSILGVSGDALVAHLKGENAALRNDLAKRVPQPGPASETAQTKKLRSDLAASNKNLTSTKNRVEVLNEQVESYKAELKELKADLKKAIEEAKKPGEVTSPRVAAAAARVLADASSSADARSIAASALTQASNKK